MHDNPDAEFAGHLDSRRRQLRNTRNALGSPDGMLSEKQARGNAHRLGIGR
jgi:hypothetical protein